MKSYLFVYGTLTDEKLRKEILGYDTKLYPCNLFGFKMSSIVLSGFEYPILIADPENFESIEGGYFELSETDLHKLDTYESDAYRRSLVKLENGIIAWVYHK
jgi:gamma-glutamylcyclotransferase (GGCT)/AIG2-like uncharacterized protein YtfP